MYDGGSVAWALMPYACKGDGEEQGLALVLGVGGRAEKIADSLLVSAGWRRKKERTDHKPCRQCLEQLMGITKVAVACNRLGDG